MQLVEPAENCCFLIYPVDNKDFASIFPDPGQDVEFVEDLFKRLGKQRTGKLLARVTAKWVPKQNVQGIHGTLFCQYPKRKKYFPNKREDDLDVSPVGRPQARLKAKTRR